MYLLHLTADGERGDVDYPRLVTLLRRHARASFEYTSGTWLIVSEGWGPRQWRETLMAAADPKALVVHEVNVDTFPTGGREDIEEFLRWHITERRQAAS